MEESIGALSAVDVSLKGRFPILYTIGLYLEAPMVSWTLALIWLAAMVTIVNLKKPGSEVAPLDTIGTTWSRLAWFVWSSTAVVFVCLAALPAFALGGLVIEDFRCRSGGIFG